MSKKTRVRARAVLSGAFQFVNKIDDPNATVESVVSTTLDRIEVASEEANDRVIRMKDVTTIVGLSRSEIYRRLREGGNFPKPLNLGGDGQNSRKGWLESEIRSWLRDRVNER